MDYTFYKRLAGELTEILGNLWIPVVKVYSKIDSENDLPSLLYSSTIYFYCGLFFNLFLGRPKLPFSFTAASAPSPLGHIWHIR